MTVSSKIRIYDLAKELKLDTKRLIEEVRREGVDVSVPSNSVSKELAEKIRNKYFPKKEAAVKRTVKVVKRAARPVEEAPAAEIEEPVKAAEPEHVEAEEAPPPPQEIPAVAASRYGEAPPAAKLMKKLPPATRPNNPPRLLRPLRFREFEPEADETGGIRRIDWPMSADAPSVAVESAKSLPAISHQIRVMRPTAAALNAGIRPGDRAPSPNRPPLPVTPKELPSEVGALEIATHYQEQNVWASRRNCDTTDHLHRLQIRAATLASHACARRKEGGRQSEPV